MNKEREREREGSKKKKLREWIKREREREKDEVIPFLVETRTFKSHSFKLLDI